MSHSLKLLLDDIFGNNNFRNEIAWKRTSSPHKGSQHKSKSWGNNTDCILFYAKSKRTKLDPLRLLSTEEILLKFNLVDENGRRYYDDSAHIWRSPGMGERPNLCYEWRGFTNPHTAGWRLEKENLEKEFQKGNFVILENGKLKRRKYEDDYKGASYGNFWDDLFSVKGKERTGYPTQKPLPLLRRIIKASSNPDDLILDPFCGCATACVAAQDLNRKWIGIDISEKAVELVLKRFKDELQILAPKIIHREDIPIRSDGIVRSKNIKHMRYGEQEGYCAGCKHHFPFHGLTIDHIVPKSLGGTDNDSNIQLLCSSCNSIKGNRSMGNLKATLEERGYLR